jgi:Ca2+-binding EF-hand superfamily protein
MSTMVGMQMGSPPKAENVASQLVDSLDTNGDGEVSAEEIAAAFGQAGLSTDGVQKALAEIDTDGNGSLNAGELTSAVSADMAAHRPPPGGPPPGGPPPNADEAASTLLSAFDKDEDGGLSLTEIASGLGEDEDTDQLSALFSSLDSDSDGMLSSKELSNAIQADMSRAKAAYAQSAQMAAELV